MRKVLCIVSMLTCMATSTVQAQNFKPYAGVGTGVYVMETGVAGIGDQTAFSGFGQFGVDYGEYFGVELRVGTSAKSSFTSGGVNQEVNMDYMFSYLAKLQFPVNDNFRIYGLFGGTSGQMALSITTPGFVYVATGTNKVESTETSGSIGGGVEYKVHDQWSVGVEYMSYYQDVYGIAGTVKFLF